MKLVTFSPTHSKDKFLMNLFNARQPHGRPIACGMNNPWPGKLLEPRVGHGALPKSWNVPLKTRIFALSSCTDDLLFYLICLFLKFLLPFSTKFDCLILLWANGLLTYIRYSCPKFANTTLASVFVAGSISLYSELTFLLTTATTIIR